jgi:type II secretory pathway pseudopilin PulG
MTAVESSTVLSVALLAVMALIIAPLLFAMIFKSERKQAKFTYQYAKA